MIRNSKSKSVQRWRKGLFQALTPALAWILYGWGGLTARGQTNLHFESVHAPSVTVSRTGVWRGGRVVLPVLNSTANFTVVQRGQGTNFAAVPNSITNISGKPHISIPTNTWSILRPTAARTPVKLSTNATLSRDVGVICISPTQGVDARLFVKAEEVPMLWDKRRLEYRTSLRIGYITTNTANVQLPPVAVLVQTHNVTLEDETNRMLTLHGAGLNGSIPVSICTDKFKTNASIIATTDVGEEAFIIDIQHLHLWDMIIQLCPGPVLFLVILGSGAGGLLRGFKSSKKTRTNRFLPVLEGLIAGPLVLSLVVGLGVSLPIGKVTASTLTSPWAWLAIAAIGGYGGAALFDKMISKSSKTA